jgi:carbonic anhydrase
MNAPRTLEDDGAVFLICSDDPVGARLAAAHPEALVLQIPGGAEACGEEHAMLTLAYAVAAEGAREVVIVPHASCAFARARRTPAEAEARARAAFDAAASSPRGAPILGRLAVRVARREPRPAR